MAEVEYAKGDRFPEQNGGYVIAWTVVSAVVWVLVGLGVVLLL